MWPFNKKKCRCPEGSVHAYEWKGRLFSSVEERARFIREEMKREIYVHYKEVVRDLMERDTQRFGIGPNRLKYSDIQSVADFFFDNAALLHQAAKVKVTVEEYNGKSNC